MITVDRFIKEGLAVSPHPSGHPTYIHQDFPNTLLYVKGNNEYILTVKEGRKNKSVTARLKGRHLIEIKDGVLRIDADGRICNFHVKRFTTPDLFIGDLEYFAKKVLNIDNDGEIIHYVLHLYKKTWTSKIEMEEHLYSGGDHYFKDSLYKNQVVRYSKREDVGDGCIHYDVTLQDNLAKLPLYNTNKLPFFVSYNFFKAESGKLLGVDYPFLEAVDSRKGYKVKTTYIDDYLIGFEKDTFSIGRDSFQIFNDDFELSIGFEGNPNCRIGEPAINDILESVEELKKLL